MDGMQLQYLKSVQHKIVAVGSIVPFVAPLSADEGGPIRTTLL